MFLYPEYQFFNKKTNKKKSDQYQIDLFSTHTFHSFKKSDQQSKIIKQIYPSIIISPDMEFTLCLNKPQVKGKMSDRFIPSRKNNTMNINFTQEQQKQNQRQQNCLINVYKKHILGVDGQSFFKYNNIKQNNKQFILNSFYFKKQDLKNLHIDKHSRKIPKAPFKVLDAPALQDDFYLNLIDWSRQNILGVGLSNCVYLWSAQNSKVTKLCDLGSQTITSIVWSNQNSKLAIGTNTGKLQIWDAIKLQIINQQQNHKSRIGALAWNSTILTSGSRDKTIISRDMRITNYNFVNKLYAHKQQVCGLKWSYDDQQLCSGGNDNKLFIWTLHSTNPILKFSKHKAAVKALSWSPHQHGLLASGGGTADRTICFWNTITGSLLSSIDTGSQVCNLMYKMMIRFSKNVNEIVSTHGYSQNQIIIWKYPQMQKISVLLGHNYRVLYLSMSPDGKNIVTGAGDQTLRFWNVFPGNKQQQFISQLTIENNIIR